MPDIQRILNAIIQILKSKSKKLIFKKQEKFVRRIKNTFLHIRNNSVDNDYARYLEYKGPDI